MKQDDALQKIYTAMLLRDLRARIAGFRRVKRPRLEAACREAHNLILKAAREEYLE